MNTTEYLIEGKISYTPKEVRVLLNKALKEQEKQLRKELKSKHENIKEIDEERFNEEVDKKANRLLKQKINQFKDKINGFIKNAVLDEIIEARKQIFIKRINDVNDTLHNEYISTLIDDTEIKKQQLNLQKNKQIEKVRRTSNKICEDNFKRYLNSLNE